MGAGFKTLMGFAASVGSALVLVAANALGHGASWAPGESGVTVTVLSTPEGHAVRAGFVGLSMEYPAVEEYAGKDPSHLDPVFVQLIRNLAPGQRPILRIGGNTTDWAWVPALGGSPPRWVKFSLTAGWLGVAGHLVRFLRARVIPSLNLEADRPALAAAEAGALGKSFGLSNVLGFEIGNEPELYSSLTWYRTAAGVGVRGRPARYNFAAFLRDYAAVAAAVPGRRLAGPSTGDSPAWTRPLPEFLQLEPRVRVVTEHRYGLDHCSPSDPVPTIQRLISPSAQIGVAESVARQVRSARAHHVSLRIEELNAVACGGWPGVSNSFASALWALETLFESVRVGVDGVNIHTRTRGVNSLFTTRLVNGRWTAGVKPEYYGLMMFAQDMPPGSRLLSTTGATWDPWVHVWAARLPTGAVRVTFINEDPGRGGSIAVVIPGASQTASLVRLSAPALAATSGVTLGGGDFGAATATGVLSEQSVAVPATRGRYVIILPAASAAMLTVGRNQQASTLSTSAPLG
jgi:hypothetical protein